MIDTLQFQRQKVNSGYIKIKVDRWVYEHKWVVEQYIHRELDENEVIHHEDFNVQNNDIDNLVLFPSKESHSHFHRQIRQFGMTKPRLTEIRLLKQNMENLHDGRSNQ